MKKYLFGSVMLLLLAGGAYAKTEYYSVSYLAFLPESNNEGYTKMGDGLYPTELVGAHIYFAPVNLPDSAEVTEVKVWVYDANDSIDVSFMLATSPLGDGPTGRTLASASSSGFSGDQCLTDTSIEWAVIDNSAFSYYLYVGLWVHGGSTKLYGVRIKYETSSTGKEENKASTYHSILQNQPNPSRGSTYITYQLPRKSNVSLKIYDGTGRVVKTLVQNEQEAGPYTLKWDGTNNLSQKVTSGTYFYILESAGEVLTRKTIVLK